MKAHNSDVKKYSMNDITFLKQNGNVEKWTVYSDLEKCLKWAYAIIKWPKTIERERF